MSVQTFELFEVNIPGGLVSVVFSPADDVLRAAGYGSAADIVERFRTSQNQSTSELRQVTDRTRSEATAGLAQTFERYVDGDITALETIKVEQPGGDFFQEVWRVMREIPAGETRTYSELAEAAGRPRAVRAAASACARNLIVAVIPCHRVVRSDGTLGGYGYGLDVKKALLRHEKAPLTPPTARG